MFTKEKIVIRTSSAVFFSNVNNPYLISVHKGSWPFCALLAENYHPYLLCLNGEVDKTTY